MPAEQEQRNNVQLEGYVKGVPTSNQSGTIATATLSSYNGKDRDGGKNKAMYTKIKGFGQKAAGMVMALQDGDKVQIHQANLSMDYWTDKDGGNRREHVLRVWELEVLQRGEPATDSGYPDYSSDAF